MASQKAIPSQNCTDINSVLQLLQGWMEKIAELCLWLFFSCYVCKLSEKAFFFHLKVGHKKVCGGFPHSLDLKGPPLQIEIFDVLKS